VNLSDLMLLISRGIRNKCKPLTVRFSFSETQGRISTYWLCTELQSYHFSHPSEISTEHWGILHVHTRTLQKHDFLLSHVLWRSGVQVEDSMKIGKKGR